MILIVDDKSENLFSLRKVLELNNFEVDTALSGEEALKKVLRKTYALIILDVQMPSMDGFEVAEAISGYKKAQATPIIFLSAVSTHKKFITKGYTSGAIDYITKPVDPDILMLKVKTFYRLYEQTNDLKEAQVALQKEVEVRKEAEKALNKKAKELTSILESIPQIAFTANADGTIEYVNEHWYEYAPDKNRFPETYKNNIDLSKQWIETVQFGQTLEMEVQIKKMQSQEYRYHLLRAIPVITDENIAKWVGTFTDINHQKMMNEILEKKVEERTQELQKLNTELEVSNNDLQQFASVASHDLKEPLRKIQVYSNIIKEKSLLENNNLDNYLDKVITSSARMSRLINDLLNYSRLSHAHFFEVADLNKILQEILFDLELLIAEKKATINVHQLPQAEVIPGLIRQLFQNLISNALKFSKKDVAPVIKVTSEIVESEEVADLVKGAEKYCVMEIQDNGIGFDEKYSNKIFTLFQRLNSRDKYEGTGIGLAVAKKIMDKHHGCITASSKENVGSTFKIILPLKQSKVTE
ncbi:hybrid sensor histidine kinase/response regulator [Segetibacter koreensis]|uniref:hybrid sensor histidine kinase/response regulator n=1 Tax=Segetibacter koreensis TaxID=398037 RepID=UPI00036C9B4A|nr:response regulator [Segetibacter koreensis]